MITRAEQSTEIFSFHLAHLPLLKVPQFLMRSFDQIKVPGLRHSESLVTMNLGDPILSAQRYNLNSIAFFACWSDESHLDNFLVRSPYQFLHDGWHVRMKLYRRWGEVAELKDAMVYADIATPGKPVVAVTLARLNVLETHRFIKWGKPVEGQVRDHKGQTLALAAIRPINTFSTFSIWKNEAEMLNMVSGRNQKRDGESHRLAMQERTRKDFHSQFTTMRFVPFQEVGTWCGQSSFCRLEPTRSVMPKK